MWMPEPDDLFPHCPRHLKSEDTVATRFATLYLMQPYIERLEALKRSKPSLVRAAHKKLELMVHDYSALYRTPLHNPRRKIWHTRVGDDIRIIDEPLSHADACAILYIDHHDKANKYGASYSADTEAQLSRATRFPGRLTKRKRAEDAPEAREIPRKALRRFGLSERTTMESSATRDAVDLASVSMEDTQRERFEQYVFATAPVPDVHSPLPGYGDIGPLEVRAADIPALLQLPLDKFLARLTSEQARLATRRGRGLQIIKGAAGSGKTIVAVRRIEHLLAQRDLLETRPILFACYNQVLRGAVVQMLESVMGVPLADLPVEVRTGHELVATITSERRLPNLGRKVRTEALEAIIKAIRPRIPTSPTVYQWTDSQVLSEIREVIYGRAIPSLEAYLAADRSGRGDRLDSRSRQVVWSIYRHFRTECEAQGVTCWEHGPARLAQVLEGDSPREPRYSAVVLDEAQDLSPALVRSIVALQAGNTDNMLIVGDAAQNVYSRGFRWSHFGLRVSGGEVTKLRTCFRSTTSIVQAALPLISPERLELDDDLVLPEAVASAEGPNPELKFFADEDAELEAISLQIFELLCNGVPASAIAVLVDNAATRRRLAAKLDGYVPFEELYKRNEAKSIDIGHASVKLLTTFSAKGLEFPVLFLPRLTSASLPGGSDSTDTESARARRVLYTAMLRAGWLLYLSSTAHDASPLLDELGSGVVRDGPDWPNFR
jgi:superfamily I DNA/RNA helicase